MMTEKQRLIYKYYFETGRSRKEIAKRVGIKYESVCQYLKTQKILKLAIEVTDMEEGVKPMTTVPTLEWTMNENMTLYNLAKKDFEIYDKMISEGQRDIETIKLRDKYQKDMKDMVKQITDHQNKFGEMLDRDALKVTSMDKDRFKREFEDLSREFQEYFSRDSWAS